MERFRQELEFVYDQLGQQLFVCALAVTGNGDLAEDAVHNAFCQALRRPRNPGNVKAYMFQSVHNAAIDIVRKDTRTKRWAPETVGRDSARPRPWDAETDDLFQHTLTAMTQLKEAEREIIMLHLVGGMKFREIAKMREQPLGTVTAYYHRAITQLRRVLEKQNG